MLPLLKFDGERTIYSNGIVITLLLLINNVNLFRSASEIHCSDYACKTVSFLKIFPVAPSKVVGKVRASITLDMAVR